MVPDAELFTKSSALQLLWPISPGEEGLVVSKLELQLPVCPSVFRTASRARVFVSVPRRVDLWGPFSS